MNKMKEKTESTGFKNVFEDKALKEILENQELKGSKKINTFLSEMDKIADPQLTENISTFNDLILKLKNKLAEKDTDLPNKVSIKKSNWETNELKFTITVDKTKDLIEIFKTLFDERKNLISPLFKLN